MNQTSKHPRRIRILLWILVGVFLEVFLFNIRHFELPFIGNDPVDIHFDDKAVIPFTDGLHSGIEITIRDPDKIPADLRSLEVQFENPPQEILTGTVHTEEEGAFAGHTWDIKLIPGVPHSYSAYLYPSNPVTAISIRLQDIDPQTITISLNKRLPIQFNWFRFGCILAILFILYVLRPGAPAYRKKLNLAANGQRAILIALLILQIAALAFTTISTYPDLAEAIQKGNLREEDFFFKNHYQLLTEALFQKSLSVLITPPEALALANNPYDPDQRIRQFPDYEWDMSYFNGKYYVYFGVVPVLTFYMPYTLLFHRYPLNDFAVLFFGILAILGLTACYTSLIWKFFPNISAAFYFIGLMLLINSSMIFWCARRPFSYELALVSALAFCVWGLSFCLAAQKADGSLNPWLSGIGCLLLACAVGCRPTALIASLLILPIYLPPLVSHFKKHSWRRMLSLLLPVAIPYAVVGISLMLYNQVRFGSFVEFGRTYQLSVQQSGTYSNGLPIASVLIGIFNTIFGNFSRISDSYPFLKAVEPLRFNFDGTKEFHTVFPVSAFFPLIYLLPLIPFYRRQIKQKGPFFAAFFILLIIVSFFLSGVTGIMVGVIQRYTTDFAWMLALAGLFMLFIIEEQTINPTLKRILQFLMILCLIINSAHMLAISGGETYAGKSWFEFMNPLLFNKIAYAFSFWL